MAVFNQDSYPPIQYLPPYSNRIRGPSHYPTPYVPQDPRFFYGNFHYPHFPPILSSPTQFGYDVNQLPEVPSRDSSDEMDHVRRAAGFLSSKCCRTLGVIGLSLVSVAIVIVSVVAPIEIINAQANTSQPTTSIIIPNTLSTSSSQTSTLPITTLATTTGSSTNAATSIVNTSVIVTTTSVTTTSTSVTTTSTSATTTSTSVTTSTTTVATTNIQYRWNSTAVTVAGVTAYSGTAANYLTYPCGIVLDSSKTLYIADSGSNRAQRWLFNASSGTTVAGQSGGTGGSALNYLSTPNDVAVDSSGNVYVVDTYNHRVVLWASGASIGTLVAGTGSPGSSNNELYNPRGIVRDPTTGTLYIADYYNHRVMRYLFGASSGTVVAGGNGQGTATNQLNFPIGLHFDSSSNSLLIANSVAHNVVRWVIGASNWTLIAGSISGTSGSTSTLLNQPQDVVLDSAGNVYVADGYNNRVQFFLSGQFNGTTIAGIGTASSAANGLYLPTSVAVDAQWNLYVSDYQNLRVQGYQRA